MYYDRFIKGSSFIQRRYQLRFISYFCGSILIMGLLSMFILYLFTYSEIVGASYYQALLTVKGLKENIVFAMMFTGLIVVILASAATLTITLIGSHKIAGPIYRVERTLESIGNGNLSLKMKFRENDAISELADNINKATESLNGRVSVIGVSLKGVKEEAERLRTNTQYSSTILLEKIRLLKKNLSDLKTD